ncbi:hypothetical protein As57867_006127, partial [Aphanomyces stellatus]
LKSGIEQWLLKKKDDEPEQLKQIKEILKSHDTQKHLLPLSFHKHIKPPVKPAQRLLVKPEVVSGKRVPFTKSMARKSRPAVMEVIYESEDYENEKRKVATASSLMFR